MNVAYLSLGSNEGDRELWLEQAMKLIVAGCGTITMRSAIYETAAWGNNEQPDFLNMVAKVETGLTAEELLQAILSAETQLGRIRTVKWGPRTIDIDILFYNNDIVSSPDLIIPHPYLQERRFILIPLADIASELVHPKLHKTIRELLMQCPDRLEVHPYPTA
jgi:2-amino-4-hydroxy-6-hydroxymethyldihydropteridine diphosphokinase